jgi:hypothetical protein
MGKGVYIRAIVGMGKSQRQSPMDRAMADIAAKPLARGESSYRYPPHVPPSSLGRIERIGNKVNKISPEDTSVLFEHQWQIMCYVFRQVSGHSMVAPRSIRRGARMRRTKRKTPAAE